jgi:hypothetical protein
MTISMWVPLLVFDEFRRVFDRAPLRARITAARSRTRSEASRDE